ncbi:hypothetical protein, partial [Mesorhizobium sp. M2C.T.Ca.TU.002.02.1.1]|uniref:hypothetical protein n=1 Tax=Mesorhizobium sp. M2C.T.Ca.TU.002.02.1.1 TaxID=2496788 RepID=UPI0019D1233A
PEGHLISGGIFQKNNESLSPTFGRRQKSAVTTGGASEINRTKEKSSFARETKFFRPRISSRSQGWEETTPGD